MAWDGHDTVYAHVFAWQRALAKAGMAIDGWCIHRRIGIGLVSGGYGEDELSRARGAQVFINQGTNGRWGDTLTADDVRAYESRAIAELGRDCARWLASGGRTG